VNPGGTHRTSLGLFLSKHELIDHERTIRRSEQLTHANFSDWFVAILERSRAFKKLVILDRRTFWHPAAQLRNAFPLSHQFDFRAAHLLACGEVFGRFIR